jgi:hypothetical protein
MPMWRRNFPTDFCVTNRGTVLTRTSNGFSEEWQNEPKPCQQRVASIDLNWLKANCAGQPPKYHKNGRIPMGFITLCLDFNSLVSFFLNHKISINRKCLLINYYPIIIFYLYKNLISVGIHTRYTQIHFSYRNRRTNSTAIHWKIWKMALRSKIH